MIRPGFVALAVDRADPLRADRVSLEAAFADPGARIIRLDGLDPVLAGDARLTADPVAHDAQLDDHILLGRDADGPLFVPFATAPVPHGGTYAPPVWQAASLLSPDALSLYGMARSLVDWHARHRFCAACGVTTRPVRAGWSRRCDACAAEHFPRVDPVVIMLAEHQGQVLLGRQARFPPRRYSALAGFVEPGETIEQAVTRELAEEAGVIARDVRYVMSQPWPFPSSLMIACTATVDDPALTIDTTEIEHAFWASRTEVAAALAGDPGAIFEAPPAMAVAHHLLRHWLGTA